MRRLTYKDAGVDVEKANLFIQKVKPLIRKTKRNGWISDIGNFSGAFKVPLKKYKEPIFVASTDGVGTKLIVANWIGKHDTIGIDLVAMCVNDVIACGAEPLFFLDYFACGRLSSRVFYEVMRGIVKGCKIAGCALIGGETAELPGLYNRDRYDLAGFSVGVVEKKNFLNGVHISKGDVILGLGSSGLHSNGYSFVRKIFPKKILVSSLRKKILKPTRIYVRPVLDVLKRFRINGIAHITGGGFYDNIIRILPGGLKAVIYQSLWSVPDVFGLIEKKGNVAKEEMYRTFNMGIGMVLFTPQKEASELRKYLEKNHRLKSWIIGEVLPGKREVVIL